MPTLIKSKESTGVKAKQTVYAKSETRLAKLMVAPSLLVIIFVAALPIIFSIWLSLNQYSTKVAGLSRFVGFSNYATTLSDPRWWEDIRNTVVFTVFSVSVELIIGISMALLLNLAFKGRSLLRSIVLLPYAILTVVSALTWRTMFDSNLGLVTLILEKLGLPGADVVWLGEPGYAMTVMILADIWKTTPFIALMVLAGLQLIPNDVLEAASIDGASVWKRFWSVTLPLLKPAIVVALIFRTLQALQVFDLPFVLTRGANKTESISMLAYQQLKEDRLVGEGSATAILVFIFVMIVSLVYIKFAGGNLGEESKK